MELEGRVAVITGGASGIGRGTALALAGRGADVVVADLDQARMAEVLAELDARGRRGVGVRCDVTSMDDVTGVRDAALHAFGHVDVVMSNAGVLSAGLPLDIPLEEWTRVLDVNLMGAVRCAHVFLPLLVEQGHGHFVTTASTAGLFPYAWDLLPYAASKAAVVNLAENLALWLRPRGVGVSCLCPAGVATNIGEHLRFFGDHRAITDPGLASNTPEVVGELVAAAIEAGTFLITTADGATDLVARRGESLDAYLDSLLGP